MNTCTVCNRQTVPQREWMALSARRRATLNKSHARAATVDLCKSCYVRTTQEFGDLAYQGSPDFEPTHWVRDGLILRPVGPRPVDLPVVERRAS